MSKLVPVTINGIEFDALLGLEETYSADIPDYPVEDGYSVSDTIILKPIEKSMTLYISNTPVTWIKEHGTSSDRVKIICNRLEELYFKRELVKVVTTDAIYTDMGITSMTISKSRELGYARQVSLNLKKVYKTNHNLVYIPDYILKSGETKSNAGKAQTSQTSSNSSTNSNNSKKEAEKNSSILYGAAKGFGFL